MYNQSYQRIL